MKSPLPEEEGVAETTGDEPTTAPIAHPPVPPEGGERENCEKS